MARALNTNYFLTGKKFAGFCKKLYTTGAENAAERYSLLTEGLNGGIRFFSSSGRTELIGNHTDHNNGYVLAAAVDLDTVAAVVKTDDRFITVNSAGYPSFKVDINSLYPEANEYGTSNALVKGVLKGFLDRGYKIGGFTANTMSNVFKGAGVSSSASFEVLICEILNTLYNEKRMNAAERAIISQYAENVYFGKPSGLMDQLSISRGGVSFMDFENTKLPVASTVDWKFGDTAFVIVNCGGDHCNLTSEYSEIRSDMNKTAGFFGCEVLRQVKPETFYNSYPGLLSSVGGRAALRAKHYFEENERVLKAAKALKSGDKNTFLRLLSDSGNSSKEQLQNCFAKTDAEQRLMFGLKIAEDVKEVKAVRVHGGGFAGTLLAALDAKDAEGFTAYMGSIFGKENVFILNIRQIGTTEVEI